MDDRGNKTDDLKRRLVRMIGGEKNFSQRDGPLISASQAHGERERDRIRDTDTDG